MRETRTEKNYIAKDAFRRWVGAMHTQFVQNRDAVVLTKKNCTYVYLRSKVGVARKSPNDKNNDVIGIAYAWARCTGQPVYYEKEEKRYTPKAGEWVYVKTRNSKTRILLKYIVEGIDSYCFKECCGQLALIDKDKIAEISRAD